MEQNLQNTNTTDKFESLNKVTRLSKLLAASVFITMPFIGGYIGYTYAPEKIVEIETVKTISNTNAFNPLYQISNVQFSTPFTIEEKTLGESGVKWINIVFNPELHTPLYSFILNEKSNGGSCYLGLCEASTSKQFKSNSGIEWSEVDTERCIGGCEDISKLYRTKQNGENYYFVIWKNSSEEYGQLILGSFVWR
jgi:hypothetical protein